MALPVRTVSSLVATGVATIFCGPFVVGGLPIMAIGAPVVGALGWALGPAVSRGRRLPVGPILAMGFGAMAVGALCVAIVLAGPAGFTAPASVIVIAGFGIVTLGIPTLSLTIPAAAAWAWLTRRAVAS